jgi:hypothetical protein
MMDKRCTRTASGLPLIGLEMLTSSRRDCAGVAVSFLPASCLELLALAKKEGALKHGSEKKISRTHLSLRIHGGVSQKIHLLKISIKTTCTNVRSLQKINSAKKLP